MAVFILFALILAVLKKKKICKITEYVDLLPLFLVELVYIYFQINALFGNFYFVQYSSYLQIAFNLSLLLPILKRCLYKQAIIGAGLVCIGSILNTIVINANNGKMPVFATLSRLTGYFKESSFSMGVDNVHILMNSDTKLNILADYIDTGFSIMSIGDLFIHGFVSLIVYYVILDVHERKG